MDGFCWFRCGFVLVGVLIFDYLVDLQNLGLFVLDDVLVVGWFVVCFCLFSWAMLIAVGFTWFRC